MRYYGAAERLNQCRLRSFLDAGIRATRLPTIRRRIHPHDALQSK